MKNSRPRAHFFGWRVFCAISGAWLLSGAVAQAADSGNLIADPGFEQGVSGFYAGSSSVSVARTTTSPITGSGSLSMMIGGYGNVWWSQSTSAIAQTFTVAADIRADSVNAGDPLQLCATVYYASGAYDGNCVTIAQTVGVVQHLQIALTLNASAALRDIHVRISGLGSQSVRYTMDNASAVLTAPGGTAPPPTPPPSPPPASQPDAGATTQPDASAASANLVADPGFESGTSGFAPQQSGDSVTQTTTSPLAGQASLKISVNAYDNIWWFYSPSGAMANAQQVAAAIDVRIDADPSATTLSVCAVAYYGSTLAQSCASAPTTTGTVTHLAPTLTTDPTQTITRAGFRIIGGNGGSAISATLDSASFTMTPASATSPPPTPPPSGNTTADVVASWTSPQQTIDGFGAATAFRANALTAADADLFFSASAGIGLTILRVGIAPTGGLLGGAWSDGALAAARGARVMATPWTAPAAWKSNGSEDNGGTLLTSHYSDWASVMTSFLGSFKANSGVNVYAVSIQNEPDLSEPYESMVFSVNQLAAFAKVLSPMLAAMSPRPKLMMGEYSTWNSLDTLTSYLVNNDKTALGLVDIFGTHQYGNGAPTPYTSNYTQPLWETEASSFESFDPSITNGLRTAEWINDALTTGHATAWLYWWLYGQNADNEGLVGSSDHPGQMTKRYYALGNFSKFVRPGWVRLATTGTKSGIYGVTAFKDPVSGSFAIVVVNASSASVPITLGVANATSGASVVPYATYDDGSGNMTAGTHGNLQPQTAIAVSSSGTFSAVVPVGVTTFVGTAH
jgi:glucuronoarabinoxylan endo-1,4-beta-xylanase